MALSTARARYETGSRNRYAFEFIAAALLGDEQARDLALDPCRYHHRTQLKASRDRKKAATGKCEGRRSYAE
jgi:hypothetical protein